MWYFRENRIVYEEGDLKNVFLFPIFTPDWELFSGRVYAQASQEEYTSYDQWVSLFPREKEHKMVQEALAYAEKHRKLVHIRGISTGESVETLRSYYRKKGYEDELVTVSISLGHALWCEKDKNFLQRKNPHGALGHVCPPLRSPADLRSLQQALRMGIIMGLEVDTYRQTFLPDLIKKQILSAYQIACLCSTYWQRHNFLGSMRDSTMTIPVFSCPCESD